MTKRIVSACVGAASAILAALGVASAQIAPPEGPSASDIDEAVASAGEAGVTDPWEGFNRKMFAVHNALDGALLVPASKAYRATTPKAGRRGVRRFLANLRAPGVFVNDVLQGEFGRAGQTMGRFLVNSTIGAGGFADPAATLIAPGHGEDFGQTLAVWGVPSGPYLVIPLLGPTTLRDGTAIGPQILMDPLIYVRTPPANIARFTRVGVGGLSAREPLIEPLEEIEAKSLDYYASLRSFYLQSRKREIQNGRSDFSDLPDIGDYEEFDELE